MPPVLKVSGISKAFPGVKALEGVELEIGRGEIVALIGENGAGKSTLMKILAGIDHPDSGVIEIDGRSVELRSPRDAATHGVAIIHQELELVDTLDVAANIFLGRERARCGFIDTRWMWTNAQAMLDRLGVPVSPRTKVSELSLAHRQMIEIARALSLNARMILMDEPTSSLTAVETGRLMEITGELRTQGISVIYISHRLAEVKQIADRVVVLRDGKNAGVLRGNEIDHDRMIQLMVGREGGKGVSPLVPAKQGTRGLTPSSSSFELQGFRTASFPEHDVSLVVQAGEILGVAGLVGAGRTELARAVFGIDRPLSGVVISGGRALAIHSSRDAIDQGIYLIPEDRRGLGLITEMTIRENVTLPALHAYSSGGLINRLKEQAAAKKICETLRVKATSIDMKAANLSGGNQQKVVLAKWLSLNPKLILFDEPTRGIDVAAKAEIYHLMRNLANEDVAIVMISSDMEEILAISDRVAVMREGQITGVLARSECSEEAIMRLAVA
jgi:ribose transport system ATP-binding protein